MNYNSGHRYGELQGLNKQETADKFGKEQVVQWRRSYDVPPPNGESLAMCAERAVKYFKEFVEPQLAAGNNVLIAAHGNSLRSIIMYLDALTSQEVRIPGEEGVGRREEGLESEKNRYERWEGTAHICWSGGL